MTRINTNVSSLMAQQTLANTNSQLQSALTQLSTGSRINSGSDDPAGLIASQALAGDITNTQQAITNSQTASQMISTADSALGQISTLLNTISGLVTQAAQSGTMSPTQIAANQSQIDSALNAIDRISQTTTFQGQDLLNGNLDFTTQAGTGQNGANYSSDVTGLQINQADLGTTGSMDVTANVTTAAAKASLSSAVTTAGTAAAGASETYNVSGGHANAGSFVFTAPTATGADYNGFTVQLGTATSGGQRHLRWDQQGSDHRSRQRR